MLTVEAYGNSLNEADTSRGFPAGVSLLVVGTRGRAHASVENMHGNAVFGPKVRGAVFTFCASGELKVAVRAQNVPDTKADLY